ncbi:tetratricopeptide repeat protein [Thaumasiovibrio sp. DFM-14]|uniref:tetratricopeptide repeat protein n=1 Tax=Thaumasiovibrio sp. DFM-14 TaxID=3384792 RepID=UPI0039A14E35
MKHKMQAVFLFVMFSTDVNIGVSADMMPVNMQDQSPAHTAVDEPAQQQTLMIEVASLTTEQLVEQYLQDGKKAMANGDSQKALQHYTQALELAPQRTTLRQQVAALHYGRRETAQAVDILQRGLAVESDNQALRLTLARLLQQESQPQAALTALLPFTSINDLEYAALRGALAHQLNDNKIALQSYRYLTQQHPFDGRWWLGLAIANERSGKFVQAEEAYQQAQQYSGLSVQSQSFVQQRLYALQHLQEEGSVWQ